MIEQMSAWGQ